MQPYSDDIGDLSDHMAINCWGKYVVFGKQSDLPLSPGRGAIARVSARSLQTFELAHQVTPGRRPSAILHLPVRFQGMTIVLQLSNFAFSFSQKKEMSEGLQSARDCETGAAKTYATTRGFSHVVFVRFLRRYP